MRGNSMICSVMVQQEENWYVAKDIVSNVASQGKTVDEALLNLKEALELYYDGITVETTTQPLFTTLEVCV